MLQQKNPPFQKRTKLILAQSGVLDDFLQQPSLEFAGVPYYRDLKDHTIRVRSDFRFPVLNLTDDEVIGQAVATALTQTPGLDVASGASLTTRKLAATSGEKTKQLFEDAAKLVEVLDLKLADHSRHHDVVKAQAEI